MACECNIWLQSLFFCREILVRFSEIELFKKMGYKGDVKIYLSSKYLGMVLKLQSFEEEFNCLQRLELPYLTFFAFFTLHNFSKFAESVLLVLESSNFHGILTKSSTVIKKNKTHHANILHIFPMSVFINERARRTDC